MNIIKNNILREKRTIKEAKLFCDETFNFLLKHDSGNFILKKGKDRFNKEFWEEYYPLFLYSYKKYSDKNYLIFLHENGSKIDAEISDTNNQCIENIQITTASFDENYALKNEKLLKDGFSLGVGNFSRNKDGSISQSRGSRSKDSAILEESNKIIRSIKNKTNKGDYINIDVLLVVSESRFNRTLQGYYKILEENVNLQLNKLPADHKKRFREIYLIDYSGDLIKLV
jgi:hypothetical protein